MTVRGINLDGLNRFANFNLTFADGPIFADGSTMASGALNNFDPNQTRADFSVVVR